MRLTPRPANVIATYRDAFGGLPRLTWLLCLAAFLNRCGAMVVPFLGLYAKERFGYDADEAGVLLSIYGVGAVAGSWLGGQLTDRIGAVRIQILALAMSGAWMFAMTRILSPGWLEAATFVLAVLNEAFRPGSTTAVATSCPPELRRKALALNRLMLNLGWAFGPTIGGYLVAVDFELMFYADGATCAIAALFLAFGLGGFSPRPIEAPPGNHSARPFRDGHFLWLMLANILLLVAFMQYFTTGSRVFEDQGYTRPQIGWFLAVNPILIVLFEMVVVHRLRNRTALPVVALGSLVVGVGYLCLLPPWAAPGIVLAMLVVAGGELLQMPVLSAYINDYAPAHARGSYNGVHGMTFSMGLILAPLGGGYCYRWFGATTLWIACGVLGLVSAWMFWRAASSPAAVSPPPPDSATPPSRPAAPPPANETTSPPDTARSDHP